MRLPVSLAALSSALLLVGACTDAPSSPSASARTLTAGLAKAPAFNTLDAAASSVLLLSAPTTALGVGGTTTVAASGTAVSGANVFFLSSDPSVATVDPWTGVVTALRAGSVAISGTAQAPGYPSAYLQLTVGDEKAPATAPAAPVPDGPIVLTPAATTLGVGSTTTVAASGSAVSGANVFFLSSDPTVATVGPWTGVVTALRAGTVRISGTAQAPGYPSAYVHLTVGGDAQAPATAPTGPIVLSAPTTLSVGGTTTVSASGTAVAGANVFFISSDPTVASVGPWTGVVTALRAGTVRVSGTAQASGYPSAFVQLTVEDGQVPTTSAPIAPALTPPSSSAAAVLAFMGAANVPTVAALQAQGDVWGRYESNFATLQDQRWSWDGLTTDANYYDRAMIYYVWWARTGNTTYLERAHQLALSARAYLESANFQVQPYVMMVDGIALHALVTGDQRSANAVAQLADYLGGSSSPWPAALAQNDNSSIDSRSQARVLAALLSAKLLNVASPSGDDWGARLRVTLGYILRSQSADGAYRWSSQCYGNKPFMTGMLNDVLVRYYLSFEADAQVLSSVKRSVDYMWNANWVPSSQGFLYQDGACAQNASADLNQLIVTGYGFVGRQTGDATYFTRGDAIFAGAVNYAWLGGAKQFNQNYTSAYRYLGLRF